ncbi:hypothetical protein MKZ38_005880 [Zalerion maritima]|uniref:Uncharacterized protein n=1 Tax=Zalerion maritima TaxID=339359 RepID=A0AAD5RJV0_9PEZI|nr:hypothetical protein MKZ38_005880 [Zalerion maritima]
MIPSTGDTKTQPAVGTSCCGSSQASQSGVEMPRDFTTLGKDGGVNGGDLIGQGRSFHYRAVGPTRCHVLPTTQFPLSFRSYLTAFSTVRCSIPAVKDTPSQN